MTDLPRRRPIPLPPDSLRPEPRPRREPAASGGGVPDRAGSSPASRGTPPDRTPGRKGWKPLGAGLGLVSVAGAVLLGLHLGGRRTGGPDPAPVPTGPPGAALRLRTEIEPAPAAIEPTGSAPPPAAGPAARPPGSSLVLQAASCRTERRAREVLAMLRARTGLEGAVLPAEVDGVRWYRVCLGPFPNDEESVLAAKRVRETRLVENVLIQALPAGWDAATGTAGP